MSDHSADHTDTQFIAVVRDAQTLGLGGSRAYTLTGTSSREIVLDIVRARLVEGAVVREVRETDAGYYVRYETAGGEYDLDIVQVWGEMPRTESTYGGNRS